MIVEGAQRWVGQNTTGDLKQFELAARFWRQRCWVIGKERPQSPILPGDLDRFRLLIDIEQAVKIETACHGCGNLRRTQIKSAKKAAR